MKSAQAFCVAILSLFVVAPVAVKAADSAPAKPLFEVVKAEYGADDKVLDVTDKVKAAVQDGKLSIAASNDNFTDPAVGVGKKLTVKVAYNGKALEFSAGENQKLEIDKAKLDASAKSVAPVSAPAPAAAPVSGKQLFEVAKAVYGGEGKILDVTDKVKAAVKGGKLSIVASNDNFTDPAEGVYKKLTVNISYNGKTLEFSVNENETLELDKAKLDAAN